jgi:Zn-dependent M28 family amino/carboxypeptidase
VRKYYAQNPLYHSNKNAGEHQHGWRQSVGQNQRHHDGGRRQQHANRFAARSRKASKGGWSIRIPSRRRASTIDPIISNFAKVGVPALYTDSGIVFVGKDEAYSKQKRDEYTAKDYHKVSDEIKPDWDLAGAVEDAQLLTTIGYRIAQSDKFPEWKSGSEFKAKRDEMMKR